MSAVTRPMTLLASGAESVVYLFTMACAAGSGVTSWVTIRLVAVASMTALERSLDGQVDVRDEAAERRRAGHQLARHMADVRLVRWALTITLTR